MLSAREGEGGVGGWGIMQGHAEGNAQLLGRSLYGKVKSEIPAEDSQIPRHMSP